jgi:hypothetical protein
MDDFDMQPQEGDTSFSIPITFDYKGGRSATSKHTFITIAILVVVFLVLFFGTMFSENLEIIQKVPLLALYVYVVLLIIRFPLLHETSFSDIYETQRESDLKLETSSIWQIFDIDETYPYTCYFRNGKKGIFIRMERTTVTGKGTTEYSNHFAILADAYNRAHALGMDLINIDYMDNVGNDVRLKNARNSLITVENEVLAADLSYMYQALELDMSLQYSSSDVYLFTSRGSQEQFTYNVFQVAQLMLGSNYISYSVLAERDIANMCAALLNLMNFDVSKANIVTLHKDSISGVTPISIFHEDTNSTEKLNLTSEERRQKLAEAKRKREDSKKSAEEMNRKKKQIKRAGGVDTEKEALESIKLDIFDDDTSGNE